ncbi:MAG TPA: response regulator [Hyphomicrobiaceae bacterium]|nr:response regulator [Hyphomicrobiaceae bacterium]
MASTANRISVALVDDEAAFLFELSQRLMDHGLTVRGYRDAATLLSDMQKGTTYDCIVADVRMPGLSGLELQQRLNEGSLEVPLILFTGYGDVDIAVSAMKAGAWDFIGKPIAVEHLCSSVTSAVIDARQRAAERREHAAIAARVAELSERHRQVLDLMVQGLTSKQIASTLKINHRTVENYRAFVMDRIGVGNIAQLVRVMLQMRFAQNTVSAGQKQPSGTGSERA